MKKSVLYWLLLGVLLMASCQQKAEQGGSENAANSTVLKNTKVKEAKPGAQVGLASDNRILIAAHKTSEVEIILRAQLGSGDMQVELNPGEGLQLPGVTQPYVFTANDTGLYRLGLQISAADNGRYYLNLKATINNGGTSSARALAVIVQVGDEFASENPTAAPSAVNQKLSFDAIENSSDEAVVSLPAQELISNQ
ncbi:MAG TPA: hypothetical protein VN030_11245 [Cellvibrio sp.]|nr:hypothetical protein [Cellvibrio sp.]